MAYRSLSDYGVVGDMRTAALISTDGSIDWMCWPDFDSPSIFGALLDSRIGGSFRISPVSEGATGRQRYVAGSNVLVTRFEGPSGAAELVDFMPVGRSAGPALVRIATGVRGALRLRMECSPAADYGRSKPDAHQRPGAVVFESATGPSLELLCDDARIEAGAAVCEFTLHAGESRTITLSDTGQPGSPNPQDLLSRVIKYWRRWISRSTYRGRWREEVDRSLLTLKLLTYEPTGAMVAAPTTSLPESPGGARNWDYRYSWIRDSALAAGAFMQAGFYDEATAFLHFLEERHRETPDEPLQLVYGIRGERSLDEKTLHHLNGYRGAAPVRIGNDAHRQRQLDFLGELVSAIERYNRNGTRVTDGLWEHLCRELDWLAESWSQPDEGIWEVRGGRRQFTHSKLMSWAAFDRGLAIANGSADGARRERWSRERDTIRKTVQDQGWSAARGAFAQCLGSDVLDASLLVMASTGFLDAADERIASTVEAIRDDLAPGSFVHRYNHSNAAPDGLEGAEGAFGLCTFWMVDALAHLGRLRESLDLFHRMLLQGKPLGLYSEEISSSGESAGNFPQGLTHLGMINSAINLDRALTHAG